MEEKAELVIVRFFGIFFFIFQTSSVWGNLISSTVLSFGLNSSVPVNSTTDISVCGRGFCPSDAQKEGVIAKPSLTKIYILASIFLIVSLSGAVVVALFVDPLKRFAKTSIVKQ